MNTPTILPQVSRDDVETCIRLMLDRWVHSVPVFLAPDDAKNLRNEINDYMIQVVNYSSARDAVNTYALNLHARPTPPAASK